jgi:hypothetical protein
MTRQERAAVLEVARAVRAERERCAEVLVSVAKSYRARHGPAAEQIACLPLMDAMQGILNTEAIQEAKDSDG